jgi:hypothetical protein
VAEKRRARVIRVRVDRHGGTLATPAAVGDQMLAVKDAGDFAVGDLEAATLLVDDDAGTLLDYTDVTFVEDTDPTDLTSPDTITLAAPLTAAIAANTSLWVYETPDDDPDDDGIVADYIALCIPEDEEDAVVTGNPLRATIPPEKRDDLPAGEQPAPGVPVVLEYDDDTDEWTVYRFRGKARGLRFVYDTFTLSGGGPQDLLLSATPRDHSEHVYANGLELHEGTDWSRTGSVISLLATMSPPPRAGYVIDVRYAKLSQASKTAVVLLPFKSTGWSYKIIGRTDATDYSAAAFDDSAWTVAAAAFGAGPTSRQPWPPATAWPVDGRIWLRRHDIPEGSGYTIKGRVEDQVEVWWNGNYVGTFTNGNNYPSIEWSLDIPAEYVVDGLQTIAIRATDEAGGDATDAAFIDIQISGIPT